MLNPNSRFLSERLISRLPQQRRSELFRDVLHHAKNSTRGRDGRGHQVTRGLPTAHETRIMAVLGRLSALSA
jgi:hypothetical protein